MAISIDSKFWWLYKTPVQYWLTHPFTVHQRLRFHRGSGVLTKRDTLIPHISCVTSWNYTLISIYSSEYVGLYYTWKSGGGGGCWLCCLVSGCHRPVKCIMNHLWNVTHPKIETVKTERRNKEGPELLERWIRNKRKTQKCGRHVIIQTRGQCL